MARTYDVITEIARGSGPSSDLSLAVWTDISDRVRYQQMVRVRAGRHGMAANSDPLTIRMRWNNRDGAATPYLSTGIFWPDIVRGLPVRVSVAATGDPPVQQAVAFVDEYELGWDESTNEAYVEIVAQGRLFYLGRDAPTATETTTASSGLRGTILATAPNAYWPVEDGTAASQAASAISGVSAMTKTGTLHFGTGDGGAGSAPVLDLAEVPTALGRLSATLPTISGAVTALRVGFVSTWPDGGFVGEVGGIVHVDTTGDFGAWKVNLSGVSPANEMEIEYSLSEDGSTDWVTQTNTSPYDGVPKWHMLELVENGADVDVTLYRNGTAVISGTVAGQSLGRPTAVKINAGSNFAGPAFGAQMPSVGHVAVWVNTEPDSAAILAAFGVDATTGEATGGSFDGESAGDRIQRLCDAAGIPVVVMPGGTSAMGPQPAKSLIELIRECEAADGGLLHDGGADAALVYIPRTSLYNRPADLTVDVDLKQLQPGFRPRLDGRDRVASLTVHQPEGSSGSYTAPNPEPAEVGIERTVTLNLGDDEDLDQHAAWRVGIGTTEGMRYPRVGLNFRRSPELLDTWLASDGIGLRVDVTNLPQQHPPHIVGQITEGYEAVFGDHWFTVDLDTIPAAPYEVIVLDTIDCTLTTAVDADDTTWSVQFSSPPIWDDSLTSLAVQCDGERGIQVSAITTTPVTLVGVGAATHANNASVTPALPASVAVRDLLCIVVAIRSSGTGTINVPTGYERMVGWHNFAILGKIHDGTESDPTVTFTGGSAGDDTSAFMFALRGTVQDPLAALVDWVDWLNPSAQDIAYPPMPAPKYEGCALVIAGWKQDDWTSVDTLAGMTELAEPDTVTGNDQGIVADYVIQTTPTAVATGSFTVTGGVSAISRGIVLAVAPGLQTLTVTRGTPAASHAAGDLVRADQFGNVAL